MDFDNDADLDIALVNGRVKRGPVLEGANTGEFWDFYAEPNLLFQNSRTGFVGGNSDSRQRIAFTDVSSRAPDFTERIEVSRGMAFGDIDRDGDIDMVVSGLDNRLRFFRNDAPPPQHHYWLSVQAITHGRDALGARVTLPDFTHTH